MSDKLPGMYIRGRGDKFYDSKGNEIKMERDDKGNIGLLINSAKHGNYFNMESEMNTKIVNIIKKNCRKKWFCGNLCTELGNIEDTGVVQKSLNELIKTGVLVRKGNDRNYKLREDV